MLFSPLLIRIYFFLMLLFVICRPVMSADLNAQRTLFNFWKDHHTELSLEEKRPYLEKLSTYALYPYVKKDYFLDHLDQLSPSELTQFKTQYPYFPQYNQLVQSYVNHLTEENQWATIVALNEKKTVALHCQFLYAKYQLTQDIKELKPVASIWLADRDLPKACDPLFDVWAQTPYKTTDLILKRVVLLLNKNKLSLAQFISKQLPDSAQKKAIITLIDQPETLPTFVMKQKKTAINKAIALSQFKRYVNKSMDKALPVAKLLIEQYDMNNEKTALYDTIASAYFQSNATDEQIAWRKKQIKTSKNSALIEREMRLALLEKNHRALSEWLALLPEEEQQSDEWLYWKAVLLIKSGKKAQASALLNQLMTHRGFYGMVSAQLLGKPYPVDLNYAILPDVSPQNERAVIAARYKNQRMVKRIEELKYFDMDAEAKQEWLKMLTINPETHAGSLARFSYDRGWGAESVQATIAGKHWDYWHERLPIVYDSLFEVNLKNKAIPKSYSLAIARQESALDPSVSSPVGAKGLMQLMPATAKEMAKQNPSIGYRTEQQLFDPAINIALGTAFLDKVYTQFGENRILASAAYNAGPSRVQQWLKRTDHPLDVMSFIDSIPFTETRRYVKSVLAYDYLYQLLLGEQPKGIFKPNELSETYLLTQ